jgi:hypothetical protein
LTLHGDKEFFKTTGEEEAGQCIIESKKMGQGLQSIGSGLTD